jgi:hypothetical protein
MTEPSPAKNPGSSRQLPARIRISPNVLFQEIEGEGVLMDTATESYFSLDAMGVTIWRLLSGDPVLETTRARLLEAFEVSPEALEKDLTEFVSRLIDAGLIAPES